MPQQEFNDFSPASLVDVIEENLREFWSNWGRAQRSELYAGPDLVRLYTGVPIAFCNGVSCARFSPTTIDALIAETIAYYSARDATWEWLVRPDASPGSLENGLIAHGLQPRGEDIGMAIDLRNLREDLPRINNLRLVDVDDDETLKQWTITMMQGFESPELYSAFIELERFLGCADPSYRRYLGLLDGRPVSTSALLLGGRAAGIYCVATLPAARGMGIGAAITLHTLREANAQGYAIAVLQATSMGRPVYRRLGFEQYSILRGYGPAK